MSLPRGWPLVALLAVLATLGATAGPADALPPCMSADPPPGCPSPAEPELQRSPQGKLISTHRTPAGVQVRGWASDPDMTKPISVRFSQGGAGTLVANGAGHEFAGVVGARSAPNVCATALNTGAGIDRSIGCVQLAVGMNPVGNLELAESAGGGVRVAGWALDPDTAAPVDLHVYAGGQFVGGIAADRDRPQGGWGASYLGYGTAHGFDRVVAANPGVEQVCVYAINTGPGDVNTLLGCRDPRLVAPSNLTVSAAEDWGLRLSWQDNTAAETGYRVEIQRADGAWIVARRTGPVNVAFANVSVATPTRGHHCVRIVAVNASGESTRLTGCGAPLAEPPRTSGQINVASFNMLGNDDTAARYGYPSYANRLEAIADSLSGFDVVLLQEVGTPQQVADLAERTGLVFTDVYLLPQPGCRGCSTGQAILSRWPLLDIRHLEGDRPGCFLGINCGGPIAIEAATVLRPGQVPVRFVNAHLTIKSADWQTAQAAQIRRELIDRYAGPVVVGGDFNGNADLIYPAGPLTDALSAAADRAVAHNPVTGRDATHCSERDPSKPLEEEDERIDHILVRGGTPQAYNGVYGKCPADLRLSDHPRISARISF